MHKCTNKACERMNPVKHHEVLSLAEDLFTVDGYQRRESWFSSELGSMRNLSSRRLPYTPIHQVELVHTPPKKTTNIRKKECCIVGRGEVLVGESGNGFVDLIQKYYMHEYNKK